MAIKVYEPEDAGEDPVLHEFAMIFKRDGVRERHEFTAEPRMDWQNLRGLMFLMDSRRGEGIDPRALAQIDRLIRRSLVNTDGTPEKWRANVVSEDTEEPWFTDPNGDHTPADMLPAYETFEAGSSRRRWVHLMENDDEITVEKEQILSLMRDLMEASADRPTKRSAASSG